MPTEPPAVLRDAKRARGYGPLPLPHALDREISSYLRSVDDERRFNDVRLAIQAFGTGTVLQAYAERMASLTVRTTDAGLLRLGLLALALAASTGDDGREVLPVAGLLYRAACLIGASPGAEFASVMGVADPSSSAFLGRFLERDDLDRIVTAMGYSEAQEPDGFRFVRNW